MGEDDEAPSKLTLSKRKWAEERKFLTGGRRGGSDRLPPGQHLVKDWPVLDLGRQPDIARDQWSLRITGAVERQEPLDWSAFSTLPQTRLTSDIHCVTTWSRYDNDWTGVRTLDLLDRCRPHAEAAAVLLQSADGYTTNLRLSDFSSAEAILAHSWAGAPLTREHGAPVRLVLPHLYFWKSAKWLTGIDFMTTETLGFWEENGYHRRGDPWTEERYS